MEILEKLRSQGIEIRMEKSRLAVLLAFSIGIGVMSMYTDAPINEVLLMGMLTVSIVISFINLKLLDSLHVICTEIVLIIGAVSCYAVMDLIYFTDIRLQGWNIVINAVPMYLMARVVYIFSRKLVLSVFIPLACAYIFAIANYYVWSFRGQPILPWDIQAIGTAATVAGSYEYAIKNIFVYVLAFCALVILAVMMIKRKSEEVQKLKWMRRGVEMAIVVAGTVIYIAGICPKLQGNLWDPQLNYAKQGLLAGFIAHIRYCQEDTISGYSYEEVGVQIDTAETIEVDGVEAENIIVIMNEAFADLRVINDDIISDQYMPFIDSLNENTIKGNLCVPVFAMQTCDTEFEVLLGASTQYTPATPYQLVMKSPTESMVSYLKEQGYYAQAFHPYDAANWNRDNVYNYLGFEEFLDYTDVEKMNYEGSIKLREYCSDVANYAKIIEEYEKHNDSKYFMFNVTMQNHSGYEIRYDDFPVTADLSMYGEYPSAETYLSLIKKSDEAFKGLVEYFSQVEEPTLICMFGDHMPGIESEFYSLLYGKDASTLVSQEKQKKYVTPLIIWANYDIEEKYIENISTNFLALEIFKAANIDIKGYWSLLNDIYEVYPVISKTGVIDANGNWREVEDVKEDEFVRLQRSIQYYRLYQK